MYCEWYRIVRIFLRILKNETIYAAEFSICNENTVEAREHLPCSENAFFFSKIYYTFKFNCNSIIDSFRISNETHI